MKDFDERAYLRRWQFAFKLLLYAGTTGLVLSLWKAPLTVGQTLGVVFSVAAMVFGAGVSTGLSEMEKHP